MAKLHATPSNSVQEGYQLSAPSTLYSVMAVTSDIGNVPGRSYAGTCYYYSFPNGIKKSTVNINEIIVSSPSLSLNKGIIPPNAVKQDGYFITIAIDKDGSIPGYSRDQYHCYYTVEDSDKGKITANFYWVINN